MKFALLTAACLFLLTMCTAPTTPPLKVRLIGLSIDQVKAELGQPDAETTMTKAPDFGPYPASVAPGDSCINLYYSDYQGEQVHVYCVSPPVFQKIKGTSPGAKKAYVIEAFTYSQGTVF